jgi:hypothetical protein
MLLVTLAVELGICQHQGDGHALVGGVYQRTQYGAVMGRAAVRRLGDHQSPVYIHGHGPLEPVAPGKPLASLLGPFHAERTDGTRCEASRVHRHRGLAVRWWHQPLDHGTQDLLQHRFVEAAEKTVHGSIVGRVP